MSEDTTEVRMLRDVLVALEESTPVVRAEGDSIGALRLAAFKLEHARTLARALVEMHARRRTP